jgi:CspA family cold shock protein
LTLTFSPSRLDSNLRGGVFWASKSGNAATHIILELEVEMAEGTIKRLTDKGFGFIDTGTNQDMFFHLSNLDGVTFEELQEGQRVTYTEGQGPKGPRAENVRPA